MAPEPATSRESAIHARFPATRDTLPRVELCDLPTPVRRLEGLGVDDLWVKDDSRSAPLWGGNKPRKLEWVLGDARARGRDMILTFGGLATNHGLATALYAREHGMRCVLALVDQPRDAHVEAQLERIRASGAEVHLTRTKARTLLALPRLLARHRPYVLPAGGSSPVGALGFVEAALELGEQVRAGELPEPAEIWLALGTGGSAAGLAAGLPLAGLPSTRVKAVLVNDKLRLSEKTLARLARRTLRGLGRVDAPLAPIDVVRGFMGAGYGHHTPEGDAAIERARGEGMDLEPVYTGKALAALLAAPPAAGPAVYWNTESQRM